MQAWTMTDSIDIHGGCLGKGSVNVPITAVEGTKFATLSALKPYFVKLAFGKTTLKDGDNNIIKHPHSRTHVLHRIGKAREDKRAQLIRAAADDELIDIGIDDKPRQKKDTLEYPQVVQIQLPLVQCDEIRKQTSYRNNMFKQNFQNKNIKNTQNYN